MKIGILQTGWVRPELNGEFGEYPAMFAAFLQGYGFDFQTWTTVEGELPSDPALADGWLLTGSAHGAYEPHDWIPPLEEFIRTTYGLGIPMAGICFGHQIMAQALGGKVEHFLGKWGLGRTTYRAGNGENLTLLAMHQDQVTETPPEAEIVLSNDFCKNAGLAYKGKAISYQPHPEFTPKFYRALLKTLDGEKIPSDQAKPAYADLDKPNDASLFAERIAGFFLENRKEIAA